VSRRTWHRGSPTAYRSKIVADLPPFDRVVLARSERLAYLTDYEHVLDPLIDR
jgi:hypothetical protein